jgi:hypothetical protein
MQEIVTLLTKANKSTKAMAAGVTKAVVIAIIVGAVIHKPGLQKLQKQSLSKRLKAKIILRKLRAEEIGKF